MAKAATPAQPAAAGPPSVATFADRRGRVTVIGDDHPTGSYVLRLQVTRRLKILCGRFKEGKLVTFEPGDHSYVGSAMGQVGMHCLAGRIAWHTSRSAGRDNHAIRRLWLGLCVRLGLGTSRPQKGQKLRWNVDYPATLPSVRLVGIYAVRWPHLIERAIGRMLEDDPATVMFEPGLGANDYKREKAAHLLRVEASEDWWEGLPGRLVDRALTAAPEQWAGRRARKRGPKAR